MGQQGVPSSRLPLLSTTLCLVACSAPATPRAEPSPVATSPATASTPAATPTVTPAVVPSATEVRDPRVRRPGPGRGLRIGPVSWGTRSDERLLQTPAAGADVLAVLLVRDGAMALSVRDRSTGEELWSLPEVEAGDGADSTATAYDVTRAALSGDPGDPVVVERTRSGRHDVLGLDTRTGAVRWELEIPGDERGAAGHVQAVDDGVVMITEDRGRRVLVLDATTGDQLWYRDGYLGSVSLAHGYVVANPLGDDPAGALLLGAHTGREAWRGPRGSVVVATLPGIVAWQVGDPLAGGRGGVTLIRQATTYRLTGDLWPHQLPSDPMIAWRPGPRPRLLTLVEGQRRPSAARLPVVGGEPFDSARTTGTCATYLLGGTGRPGRTGGTVRTGRTVAVGRDGALTRLPALTGTTTFGDRYVVESDPHGFPAHWGRVRSIRC